MLVQFGNNWIKKIPWTAKLDAAYSHVQFWQSSEYFSSNYFQIGQHVVLQYYIYKSPGKYMYQIDGGLFQNRAIKLRIIFNEYCNWLEINQSNFTIERKLAWL